MNLEEARKTISTYFRATPIGIESVPLLDGINRVLARDVRADIDIPPFDRSTVDGYAVNAVDVSSADENKIIELQVIGSVRAGEKTFVSVKRNCAAEIVTGAPLPEGANAVIMLENVERKNDFLLVGSAVAPGENVMKAGSDIKKGEVLLRTGESVGSNKVGVIAAVGVNVVTVWAVPRVAVLSTGAEVAELGTRLPPGKIFDINAYALSGAVLESGGRPSRVGIFPDNEVELKKVISTALSVSDLVLTSGGVSVGPTDVMPRVLDSLGKPGVIICGVAIKPGKPLTVAFIGEKPIFALPGHPASALLLFHLLVRPLLERMTGRPSERYLSVKAIAGMRLFSAKGRRTFIMVRLRKGGERLVAEPVETGLSGAITTLTNADGFVEIKENLQFVDAGENVTVNMLRRCDTCIDA